MDFPIQTRDDSLGLSAEYPVSCNKCLTGSTSLVDRFSAPLTVIKGNAQLIRRRAKGLDDNDALVLERSVVAIELAVQGIITELTATSGIPTKGDSEKPDQQG